MSTESKCKAVTQVIQEAREYVSLASDTSQPVKRRALAIQDTLLAVSRGIRMIYGMVHQFTANGNADMLEAAGFQAEKIHTLNALAVRACNLARLLMPVESNQS